jgi:homogentisate 1,2-dioxygenase
VHDNVEADEVLFYVRGNFGSRRGIESGSITLHPRGIPHGPHPGTIMASKNATRTEELAVMFDTQHTLELTEESLALDDSKYPQSLLDKNQAKLTPRREGRKRNSERRRVY